jgi:hypothetical protein
VKRSTKEIIVKRPLVLTAAVALAGALLGPAPQATAEVPDCTQVIDGFSSIQFAVGITKTKPTN